MTLPIRIFLFFARIRILSLVTCDTDMVVCTLLMPGWTGFLPHPGLDPPLVSILSISISSFYNSNSIYWSHNNTIFNNDNGTRDIISTSAITIYIPHISGLPVLIGGVANKHNFQPFHIYSSFTLKLSASSSSPYKRSMCWSSWTV